LARKAISHSLRDGASAENQSHHSLSGFAGASAFGNSTGEALLQYFYCVQPAARLD
jgi:hypothetical protein